MNLDFLLDLFPMFLIGFVRNISKPLLLCVIALNVNVIDYAEFCFWVLLDTIYLLLLIFLAVPVLPVMGTMMPPIPMPAMHTVPSTLAPTSTDSVPTVTPVSPKSPGPSVPAMSSIPSMPALPPLPPFSALPNVPLMADGTGMNATVHLWLLLDRKFYMYLCITLFNIPYTADPNVLAQQQQALINQQAIILVSILSSKVKPSIQHWGLIWILWNLHGYRFNCWSVVLLNRLSKWQCKQWLFNSGCIIQWAGHTLVHLIIVNMYHCPVLANQAQWVSQDTSNVLFYKACYRWHQLLELYNLMLN